VKIKIKHTNTELHTSVVKEASASFSVTHVNKRNQPLLRCSVKG